MNIPFISSLLRQTRQEPPPHFVPLATATRDHNVHWHQVFDSERVARPLTHRLGAIDIDWSSQVSAQHPPMGIVELPSGYTLTSAGWAIDEAGVAIADTTWYGHAYAEIKKGSPRTRARRIRGTVLSLLSDFAQVNYYHFLVDALARYALYERIAGNLTRPDVILCPRPFTKRLERWVDWLGVRDCRIEFLGTGERVRADRILLPSFPGERRDCAAWAAHFWRERRFGTEFREGKRKLYLPRRSTTRAITNEPALEAALVARGFEIVDPTAIAEPESLFAEAKIVLGAHGAALTDCLFCPPNAVLVEIVPSDHVFPYYYCLAGAADLRYAYIVGTSVAQRSPGTWGPSPYDFSVDVAALLAGLDRLDG
jgi:Glycosyltransferase 61